MSVIGSATQGTPRRGNSLASESDAGSQASPAPRGTPRLQNSLRLGAEAMLSGSPARHAYKKALASGLNPPHVWTSWPERAVPAGMPPTDPSAPRRPMNPNVVDFLSSHLETGAQRLCDNPVYGSRFAHPVPKPVLAGAQEVYQRLGVALIGARGLRNADNCKIIGEGVSDPYCVCEIPGKPHSKIKTHVAMDTLDPVWDYEADVLDFAEGDSLRFSVYDYDRGEEFGDLLGTVTLASSQFYPDGFEGEVALAEAGQGIHSFLRISIPDQRSREAELHVYGGLFPDDDATAQYVRKFVLSVRRLGFRGIPFVSKAFNAVASPDGVLDAQGFNQVARAQGLCSCFAACNHVFRHFTAAGGGVVRADALIDAARGTLRGRRLEAVRQAWKALDPDGRGFITVAELMAAFDPRRLPSVRYDGVNVETARREYLEGLGVARFVVETRMDAFQLEEVVAGRRPLPIGAPAIPGHKGFSGGVPGGGGAVAAPAGKEGPICTFPREHGDYMKDVRTRQPRAHKDAQVSAVQFENFYTALSHGITDDRSFEAALFDPWTCRQVHEEAIAPRSDNSPRKKAAPKAPQFRIFATFEDGSRRVVQTSNIDGLSDSIGHAGVDCCQMWCWGPGIRAELIRRLEDEGIKGVRHVQIIPC